MRSERKEKLRKLTGKIVPQLIFQSAIIIVTAIGSYFFMTWLVADFFGVRNIYAATGYETIGALVILVLTVVPLNVAIYRSRAREVITLSDAITRVAKGDYSTRITAKNPRSSKAIYSDFNKMCAELESVQLLRNDFINSYSHEFKTPIASINGFASLLMEKELPPETQQQYLEIIVDESARLSKLATNTILLSKLSAQQIVTDTEEYDLGEQLRQCSIILSPIWMEKKIEFNCEVTPISYRGNKEMMQHLWLNLLDNAIKYTPVGGEITVNCHQEAGAAVEQAVIRIKDTGEGIRTEIKDKLFDPYFQGDAAHSRPGLGLGLSIAKRIVELTGGSIRVDSEPSVGSTFTVVLPLLR